MRASSVIAVLCALVLLACDGRNVVPTEPAGGRSDGVVLMSGGAWYCNWIPDSPPPPPDDGGGDMTRIPIHRNPNEHASPQASHDGVQLMGWDCHFVPGASGGPPPDPSTGGGGSGYYSYPPNLVNDEYFHTYGSLWYDVAPGEAEGPPDCTKEQQDPIKRAWCDGAVPDGDYVDILNDAAAAILQRCPELATAWAGVQGNIRLFLYYKGVHAFGGGAAKGDHWILLSYQWLLNDPQLGLAHELLHVHNSVDHAKEKGRSPEFKAKEEQCSGGRSTV